MPQRRLVPLRVRAFADFLAEKFGDTPPWDASCCESFGAHEARTPEDLYIGSGARAARSGTMRALAIAAARLNSSSRSYGRFMSSHDIRSAQRPDPDQPMVDIANYVADYTIESQEAYDTARYMLLDSLACAMLAMKFPECVKHLGPLVPGAVLAGRRARAGHGMGTRSGAGRVQHRRAGALARFQRHLARGRVGPSVGQSRRDPRRRRLPLAQGRARRRQAADRARRARLRDQGARDPGLLRAEELVQSRRPRSRDSRAAGIDRRRDAHARRRQGRHRQRRVA